MKRCPACNRTYPDDTLAFCLVDGTILSAPYNPEAASHISNVRSADPPPTEVMSQPALSNNPLSATVTSPSPSIYTTPDAQIPKQVESVGVLKRLTHGTFRKIAFGVISGYAFAVILSLMIGKIEMITDDPLYFLFGLNITGAVYGLLTGIVIVAIRHTKFFESKAELTGAIIGIIVGAVIRSIIEVYSIYGTGLLYIFGMREDSKKMVAGGWLGAIIFGAILGVILGKVYRADTARDVV